jgi:hypothetical protein
VNRPFGMASPAFSAYVQACVNAHIDPHRVLQTIGEAKASGHVHEKDGELHGEDYCAATDLSVHHPALHRAQVIALCQKLAEQGFAAFYRWPGHDGWPSADEEHIHMVYAGLPMKAALREQIHDYLHGKNGLASHGTYTVYQPSEPAKQIVRTLFLGCNPAAG